MYGCSGSNPHAHRKRDGWSPGSARPFKGEIKDAGKRSGDQVRFKLEVKTERFLDELRSQNQEYNPFREESKKFE